MIYQCRYVHLIFKPLRYVAESRCFAYPCSTRDPVPGSATDGLTIRIQCRSSDHGLVCIGAGPATSGACHTERLLPVARAARYGSHQTCRGRRRSDDFGLQRLKIYKGRGKLGGRSIPSPMVFRFKKKDSNKTRDISWIASIMDADKTQR